jgi:hypothetical protein
MRKLLITSIILFTSILTFGQNEFDNIIEGPVFKDQTNWTQIVSSEDDGNGGLVIVRTFHVHSRSNAEAYYIEHYDSDLKLTNRVKIDNASSNIVIDNGVINMIMFGLDKATNAYEFNLLSSSIESMKFEKKHLCSSGEDQKLSMSLYASSKTYDPNSFGTVYFSENKNYSALIFDIKNEEEATHKVFVFNKKFEQVKEYTFKKNIPDVFFDFQSVNVDDTDGSILLLGKVFENNTRKLIKDDKVNYHYELFKLTNNGQEKVDLQTNNNFVKSLVPVRKGNNLSYVGFYGKDKEEKSNGVCRFDINIKNLSIEKSSFAPFSDDFIIEKLGKKSDKGLKDLNINTGYMQDNGNIILAAEEQLDKYGQHTGITYLYDDIISIKMNNNGELTWAKNIIKEQADTYFDVANTVHASYGSVFKNDKLYYFFNASPKIKESKKGVVEFGEFKRDKSAIYCVILDENGKSNYKKIYEDKDLDILFHTEDNIIDAEGNIIIFGDSGEQKRFLKIKI